VCVTFCYANHLTKEHVTRYCMSRHAGTYRYMFRERNSDPLILVRLKAGTFWTTQRLSASQYRDHQ
jgi:hypothetical protein